jgi:flagellar basal body-associated protein FliL
MAEIEAEATNEPKKKGRKGPIIALLAVIGAGVAALMFWRSRRSSGDEEDEDEI